MIGKRVLGIVVAAIAVTSMGAKAEALDGPYRGEIVCEQILPAVEILRLPIDLMINGGTVVYSRPIYNSSGTLTIANELGAGTVEADGKLHLRAIWNLDGVAFQGEYNGLITATGGTFIGTQTRRPANGRAVTRTCTGAFVPAPKLRPAATPSE